MSIHGNVDLLSLRQLADSTLEGFLINVNPIGSQSAGGNLGDVLETLDVLGFLSDFDNIACLYEIGRNVDGLAVDSDVLVADNLACFTTGAGKAHTENDIVQTALKHGHEVFTGHAFHPVGLVVVVTERLLKDAVDEFSFLLLAKLCAILAELAASADQLSFGLLVISKKNGIKIERSASLQYRSSVYCHDKSSFLFCSPL